jgi:glycosyltransferase involved in cell wall biosynthesis
VSHRHGSWHERIDPHPAIVRYAGVSRVTLAALVDHGVPVDRTMIVPNFVDIERFRPRGPLPRSPRRALVFSNYAHDGAALDAISAACVARGIELDVVGAGVGRACTAPERILGEYDLVFAKARAAMEALAVGCAVVVCDFAGLGPIVASADLDRLRLMNFGHESMTAAHDAASIGTRIDRYDADDAAAVTAVVRAELSLGAHINRLEVLYDEILTEILPPAPPVSTVEQARAIVGSTAYRWWGRLPPAARSRVRSAVPTARRAFAR